MKSVEISFIPYKPGYVPIPLNPGQGNTLPMYMMVPINNEPMTPEEKQVSDTCFLVLVLVGVVGIAYITGSSWLKRRRRYA